MSRDEVSKQIVPLAQNPSCVRYAQSRVKRKTMNAMQC